MTTNTSEAKSKINLSFDLINKVNTLPIFTLLDVERAVVDSNKADIDAYFENQNLLEQSLSEEKLLRQQLLGYTFKF